MIVRALSLCAALTVLSMPACVGAPSRFSARSAASPEAAEAPRVQVGRALTEEPPLPGASTEGWAGLAAPSSGGMPMGHMHHHVPGMDMSGMEGMDMHDSDAGMDMQGMEGMDMHGMHMDPPAPTPTTDATDGGVMQGMDHAH